MRCSTMKNGWNVMVSTYLWPCAILSEACGNRPWSRCHWAVDIPPELPWSSPGATDDLWHPASWAWPRSRPPSSARGHPARRWRGAVESLWRVMDEEILKAVLLIMCVSPCWFMLVYLHSDVNVVRLFVQCFRVLLSLHWCKRTLFKKVAHESEISWKFVFLCLNILYIDFPLGLNMLFLCSGDPLRSSWWKALLCWGKSSFEKPLKCNKEVAQRRGKSGHGQGLSPDLQPYMSINKTIITAVIKVNNCVATTK